MMNITREAVIAPLGINKTPETPHIMPDRVFHTFNICPIVHRRYLFALGTKARKDPIVTQRIKILQLLVRFLLFGNKVL